MEDLQFDGCVMLEFDMPFSYHYFKTLIDPKDLYWDSNPKSYSNGIVNDSHITLFYGLRRDVKFPEVYEAIEYSLDRLKNSLFLFSNLSLFENEKYDVLKLIPYPQGSLRDMNTIIQSFPNQQTFPDYNPHMTVAYLLPGTGNKYTSQFQVEFESKLKSISYSMGDDKIEHRI